MNMQSPVLRGYDIRFRRAGSTWLNEKSHGLAVAGSLPAEWAEVISNPEVLEAVCYPSSQRQWRADRRKLLAEYRRPVA